MEVLGGEAERGEFSHCPPVILVSALAVTEVKITDSGGVFNYTSSVLFESKFKKDTFLAAARSPPFHPHPSPTVTPSPILGKVF